MPSRSSWGFSGVPPDRNSASSGSIGCEGSLKVNCVSFNHLSNSELICKSSEESVMGQELRNRGLFLLPYTSMKGVLLCYSCHDKMPQTKWLKLFLLVMGAGRVDLLTSLLTYRWLPPPYLFSRVYSGHTCPWSHIMCLPIRTPATLN